MGVIDTDANQRTRWQSQLKQQPYRKRAALLPAQVQGIEKGDFCVGCTPSGRVFEHYAANSCSQRRFDRNRHLNFAQATKRAGARFRTVTMAPTTPFGVHFCSQAAEGSARQASPSLPSALWHGGCKGRFCQCVPVRPKLNAVRRFEDWIDLNREPESIANRVQIRAMRGKPTLAAKRKLGSAAIVFTPLTNARRNLKNANPRPQKENKP